MLIPHPAIPTIPAKTAISTPKVYQNGFCCGSHNGTDQNFALLQGDHTKRKTPSPRRAFEFLTRLVSMRQPCRPLTITKSIPKCQRRLPGALVLLAALPLVCAFPGLIIHPSGMNEPCTPPGAFQAVRHFQASLTFHPAPVSRPCVGCF